jgi:hypothetical protein
VDIIEPYVEFIQQYPLAYRNNLNDISGISYPFTVKNLDSTYTVTVGLGQGYIYQENMTTASVSIGPGQTGNFLISFESPKRLGVADI